MGELGGTQSHNSIKVQYLGESEVDRLMQIVTDTHERTRLFAAINRYNTLYMIMNAGSGHIGSSFSAMDIVSWLWLNELESPNDSAQEKSDTYFSSKGHDAPGLYSTLISLKKLPFEVIHLLRRMHGLPGHPDVHTPYIATNTGSLGMGVSKAHGMVLARRAQKKSGRIYVLTGDGELQEGQFWESLQPAANAKLSELTIFIDYNKIQSDKLVSSTSDLGSLEEKLKSFGWEVLRIDGHSLASIETALKQVKAVSDRPQIIIADTVKGKGVSFMEKLDEEGYYKFHSGAPSVVQYEAACIELLDNIKTILANNAGPVTLETKFIERPPAAKNPQRLIAAYSAELLDLAKKHPELIALDADLVLDTGLIPFAKQYPDQYLQAGIAEQDMVSRAGGLALQGMLPVVHSFSCFLTTRANEQIYNNATERRRIIYTGSLAGLLPGMPGHSHQSLRDISTLGSIPGLIAIEPATELEVKETLRWAVERNSESTYIRLVSIPYEVPFTAPTDYPLTYGRGYRILDGTDAVIVAYGPIMLTQAYLAASMLKQLGHSICVINLPWLNVVDEDWFVKEIKDFSVMVTLDNHYTKLGQGAMLSQVFAAHNVPSKFVQLGINSIPACGTNSEVLEHHKLDASSIRDRMHALLNK